MLLLVLDHALGRLRDEDLASVAGCADACGTVDRKARVTAVGRRRLTGVDADPHLQFALVRPGMARECQLGLDRSEHGLVCAFERVEERVALRVDLVPSVTGEGRAYQSLVVRQRLRVPVAQLPDEPCRALDVREHEGDRAAREVRHRDRKPDTLARCARIALRKCRRAAATVRSLP